MKKGFIALLSTLIISAVLIVVAVTLSLSSFYIRFNILNSEYKEKSDDLAHSCISLTLLKLATDPEYIGEENSEISQGNICSIGTITSINTEKIFDISTNYNSALTHIQVTIDVRNFTFVSLEEIPS